jgi:uncharacterized membrane protein YdjX (TVP38/TMEM64 family)
MIKRNLSKIVLIIAMLLNILSFDFVNFSLESTRFRLFICATVVFVICVILIFVNEAKHKNKNR